MARRLAVLLALALALVLAGVAQAAPPPVEARAVLVVNATTGEVLHERNARARVPIASITKIMTALVALEHGDPDATATVGAEVTGVGGSSIGLAPGERIPVRDLLAAVLVQSANDAAFALAAHVGGDVDRFVALMNRRAAELGLRDTSFVRPDGLDVANHHSSAHDVFRLARRGMREPLVRELAATRTLTIAGGRRLETWNDLLGRYRGVVGVKTGHTNDAGWSQVAAARRKGVTVYAVVLGSPSREQRNEDLVELLDWAFDRYARVTVVEAGRAYAEADVPFSDERLPLVSAAGVDAVVRVGRPLVEEVRAPAVVALPVERGDELGEVCVAVRERTLCRPLLAAADVPAPSLARRVGWYAGRAVRQAFDMVATVLGAVA